MWNAAQMKSAATRSEQQMDAMEALIVYAHPEPKSFNAAMKDRAVEVLEAEGWSVTVSDLYAMGFKAEADGYDFTDRADPAYLKYAAEQSHAARNGGGFAQDIQAELEKLKRADLLILQFPVWWFGFPAILKGWVDRVFAAGVIYGGDIGMFSRGRFKGRRAFLSFTTGGTAATYGPTGLYGSADVVFWPIQNGILNFLGYSVLPFFQAEAPSKTDEAGRAAILTAWETRLRSLDSLEPLDFHDLADFDQETGWTFKPGVEGRTVAQTGKGQAAE